MPRKKKPKTPKPGTFGKGAANPKFKHGLYAGGGREWIEKRDFLYHLSRSALDPEGTPDDGTDDEAAEPPLLKEEEEKQEKEPTSGQRRPIHSKRTKKSPPPPGPSAEEIVRGVYSLSADEFAQRFIPASLLTITAALKDAERSYTITHHAINALPDALFKQCFSLIEETSLADYKAAKQGWQPEHKREEMTDSKMHYLLVEEAVGSGAEHDGNGLGAFQGFLSFMVDTEVVPPSEDKVAIIYIYELHLKPSVQGSGLGKHLMTVIEDVGRRIGIAKTMLTVFTSNTGAERFYRRLGYGEDPISPYAKRLRNGTEKKPDYYILSKPVGDAED